MRRIALALFLLLPAAAQAQHGISLTWTASTDATASSTANIYTATGTCPASGIGTLTWTKYVPPTGTTIPAGGSYVVPGFTGGQIVCVYVTNVIGTVETQPSNTGGGMIPYAKPNLTIVILN